MVGIAGRKAETCSRPSLQMVTQIRSIFEFQEEGKDMAISCRRSLVFFLSRMRLVKQCLIRAMT